MRQYSFAKKIQRQTITREKLRKTLLYEKDTHEMLMKLTPAREQNPNFLILFLLPNTQLVLQSFEASRKN